MYSHDPYPTPACDEAREYVKEVHTAFLEHVRRKPTKATVENTVLEELKAEEAVNSDAPVAQAPPAPELAQAPTELGTTVEAAPGATSTPIPAAKPNVSEDEEPVHEPVKVPHALDQETISNFEEIASRTRATAERNRLDALRKDVKNAKRNSLIATFVIGTWMAFGFSDMLARVIRSQIVDKIGLDRYGLTVPVPMITLVLASIIAGLITYVTYWLANALQVHRIASKAAREIPYIDTIGHIYEIEYLKTSSPDEEQGKFLEKKLETVRKTVLNGKTLQEAREELRIATIFFAVIAAFCAIANFLFFPHRNLEEAVFGILAAALPVAFVWLLMRFASNHTIQWPRLAEELTDPSVAAQKLSEHRERVRQAEENAKRQRELDRKAKEAAREAELKAADEAARIKAQKAQEDADKERKKQDEDRLREKIQTQEKVVAERLVQAERTYVATTEARLADLKAAAATFESHRGYSRREQMILRERLTQSRLLFWGLLVPSSALLGILATYPASLTLWSIFGLRFQYIMQNRVAPISWVFWMFLIAVAEVVMVMGLHKMHQAKQHERVLEHFYDEEERLNGQRYRIKNWAEINDERKSAKRWITFGVLLLSLEFIANSLYLLQNSDANRELAIILALVPLALFVALTIPHTQNHHRRSLLREAIDWARSLPDRPPGFVKEDPNADAPSRTMRNRFEQETSFGNI